MVELSQLYLRWHKNALTSPKLTSHYVASCLVDRDREVFMVIFLNNQNKVIYNEVMFVGTYHCVDVHPREIVYKALKSNAAALI